MQPIWQDYFVSLGSGTSQTYRILVNGQVIFVGTAYKRPGEGLIKAKINEICANYLGGSTTPGNGVFLQTFTIQKMSGTSWVAVEDVEFLNDWSYDRTLDAEEDGLVIPINGKVAIWQSISFPTFNETETIVIYFKDGTSITYEGEAVNGYVNVNEALQELDVTSYTIGGHRYTIAPCANEVLHYTNVLGAWESLVLEGRTQKMDNIKRGTYSKRYDNFRMETRGEVNNYNDMSQVYTFRTGWMTDEESLRMHNLIESTNVYLENSAEDMIPLVITNTSMSYKTYKTEGNRLVSYEIEARVATDMTRR